MQGLHSVSINLSYRITLELLIQDEEITPITWAIMMWCIDAYPHPLTYFVLKFG